MKRESHNANRVGQGPGPCRLWFTAVALALLFVPSVAAETLEDVVKSYVGQKRILRHAPEKPKWELKWKRVGKLKKGRGAAVEIVDATLSATQIRFQLAFIGTALVPPQKKSGAYRFDTLESAPAEVVVSHMAPAVPPDLLRAQLDRLFQTSEAYLAAHGVSFGVECSADADEAVFRWDSENPKPANAKHVKLLLQVMPSREDAQWMARNQPEVEAEFIVGSDGCVRAPQIVKGTGTRYAQQLLMALEFWRFAPAELEGRRVAVHRKFTMKFILPTVPR